MSINRVLCSGNLTRDAEIRRTAQGLTIANFCMAVNSRRKNQQSGEWENYPNYVDVTVFGKKAEFVEHGLTKGAKVFIDGELRWSSWEKDGQKRSKLEVVANDIELTKKPEPPQDELYATDLPF